MTRSGLVLMLAGACVGPSPDVRVEYQPATLEQVTDTSWIEGSVVLVGAPGTFTFPQPLSLRLSLLDGQPEDLETPDALPISRAKVGAHGTASYEVIVEPDCEPTFCEAELAITGIGQSMFEVTLTGGDGDQAVCFYYAVFEDPDPAGASASLRAEVEAQQSKCRQALVD